MSLRVVKLSVDPMPRIARTVESFNSSRACSSSRALSFIKVTGKRLPLGEQPGNPLGSTLPGPGAPRQRTRHREDAGDAAAADIALEHVLLRNHSKSTYFVLNV